MAVRKLTPRDAAVLEAIDKYYPGIGRAEMVALLEDLWREGYNQGCSDCGE